MVRGRRPKKTTRGLYETIEWGEIIVSQTDTFVLGNHYASANPYSVTLIKKTDGSAMTCTYTAGTSTVTVTGAGSDVDCFYMAYGRRI